MQALLHVVVLLGDYLGELVELGVVGDQHLELNVGDLDVLEEEAVLSPQQALKYPLSLQGEPLVHQILRQLPLPLVLVELLHPIRVLSQVVDAGQMNLDLLQGFRHHGVAQGESHALEFQVDGLGGSVHDASPSAQRVVALDSELAGVTHGVGVLFVLFFVKGWLYLGVPRGLCRWCILNFGLEVVGFCLVDILEGAGDG